ncbi:unnamed protein product [Moneuplotes crassus]|uniref:Uncharacterized protein n=1 Tax=Euplotes crassus TaxID=5936 RepID=A0AAD1XCB4_EUPCR|nr:unnamed protein product [Moneuplotes crassus]
MEESKLEKRRWVFGKSEDCFREKRIGFKEKEYNKDVGKGNQCDNKGSLKDRNPFVNERENKEFKDEAPKYSNAKIAQHKTDTLSNTSPSNAQNNNPFLQNNDTKNPTPPNDTNNNPFIKLYIPNNEVPNAKSSESKNLKDQYPKDGSLEEAEPKPQPVPFSDLTKDLDLSKLKSSTIACLGQKYTEIVDLLNSKLIALKSLEAPVLEPKPSLAPVTLSAASKMSSLKCKIRAVTDALEKSKAILQEVTKAKYKICTENGEQLGSLAEVKTQIGIWKQKLDRVWKKVGKAKKVTSTKHPLSLIINNYEEDLKTINKAIHELDQKKNELNCLSQTESGPTMKAIREVENEQTQVEKQISEQIEEQEKDCAEYENSKEELLSDMQSLKTELAKLESEKKQIDMHNSKLELKINLASTFKRLRT